MAKLWFENSLGQRRVIADCNTWTEVCDAIDDFIDKLNENKPANKRFVSYYKRVWQSENQMEIDVGSWTEFFYWDKVLEVSSIGDNGEEIYSNDS